MRLSIIIVAIMMQACASTLPQQVSSTEQVSPVPLDEQALATVKSIYLGSFGSGEGSDLVREKVRMRLQLSNRFAVVDREEQADAVLLGAAGVKTVYKNGETDYVEFGLLRLVDRRTQKTIWGHEYKRRNLMDAGVADQTVDELLKDSQIQPQK